MCNLCTILLSSSSLQGVLNKQLYSTLNVGCFLRLLSLNAVLGRNIVLIVALHSTSLLWLGGRASGLVTPKVILQVQLLLGVYSIFFSSEPPVLLNKKTSFSIFFLLDIRTCPSKHVC